MEVSEDIGTIKWQNFRKLKKTSIEFQALVCYKTNGKIELVQQIKSAGKTITHTNDVTLHVTREPSAGRNKYKSERGTDRKCKQNREKRI